MSETTNRVFSTPSTPLAIALHLLGVPFASDKIRCAATYRQSYLIETKAELVKAGKWPGAMSFTPQDAQKLGYADQTTFFFQAGKLLDVILKGWQKGCELTKDSEYRVDLPDIEAEQAATLLALALGPNGTRSRMIRLFQNAAAKLAVQKEDGSWVYLGKDATEETIEYLTK